jgi:hypothetical protein
MKDAIFEWEHEPVNQRTSLAMGAKPPPVAPAWKDAWTLKRDAPRDLDIKLTSLAVAWASAVPLDIRPVELCLQYPRIANRLALTWQDVMLTKRVLDSLIVDKRRGRRGFPKAVAAELMKMAAYVARQYASDGRY